MSFKYSLIGLDSYSSHVLISNLAKLADYEQVGARSSSKPLDVILSGNPNLIFINVDDYNEKKFRDLTNIIKDLYRSFVKKPYLVALARLQEKAYNCIKYDFYYYLLLPIDQLELQKLDHKLRLSTTSIDGLPKKLCLQSYSDYRFIEIDDILFLKADNNTTEFFMIDNTKIMAYKTLKHFESILPESFCRIHQSFIVNQNFISRIHLGKSECHLKTLKTRLPFSKSYRNVMTELANKLSSQSLS